MLIHSRSPCYSGNHVSGDSGRWFEVDQSRGNLPAIHRPSDEVHVEASTFVQIPGGTGASEKNGLQFQVLAPSSSRACLQESPLCRSVEELQIVRWPVPPAPSQFRRSGGHCGHLRLQRCRRCRTFLAQSSSHTTSTFHPH